jgi:tryptophan-rich sensory protein
MGAMLVFVLGPLAAVVSSRSVKPPLSYLFVILGLISLAFVPIVAIDVMNALTTYTIAKTAGAENMIMYPFLSWALAFGTYLMKD